MQALDDLRSRLEEETTARIRKIDAAHEEDMRAARAEAEAGLSAAREREARGMSSVMASLKNELESISQAHAAQLVKLRSDEREERRAELAAVKEEHRWERCCTVVSSSSRHNPSLQTSPADRRGGPGGAFVGVGESPCCEDNC